MKIYFTPWNTVEVWNLHDFDALKRVWLAQMYNPERVYIDKNSLPVSDIVADTLIDTSGNFYSRQIEGLAFAIPFNLPDTFEYEPEDTTYGSMPFSGSKRAEGCLGRKKFTGKIENLRIFTTYIPSNNGGVPVKVWLRNALIKIRVNRWPDATILECRTDNDGYIVDGDWNRTFNIDFCAGAGKSSKKMHFEIGMCDPDNHNSLRVKRSSNWENFHVCVTPDVSISYSDDYPVISGDFGNNAGSWFEMEIHYEEFGLLYTQLTMAKNFVNEEWQGTGKSLDMNLAIKIERDRWIQDNSDKAEYNHINRTIHLGTDRYTVEGTVFHEFGHYVFHHAYGIWNYGTFQNTHYLTWNNPTQPFTMSEGIANAFAGIMDEMTWAILGNSSNERNFHNRPFFRVHDDIVDGYTFNVDRLTTPVLSEAYLAGVVLDLWDGPQNYSNYSNTNLFGPSFGDAGSDDFEMSFKDICSIFWNNQTDIESVYDLYRHLVNGADCSDKSKIRRIFQYNSESIDISVNPVKFPDYSSDEIEIPEVFEETGFNINKTREWGTGSIPSKWHPIQNSVSLPRNISVLNGTTLNYNMDYFKIFFGSNLVSESSLTRHISDDLDLINGALIEFNTNNASKFYNNGGVLLSGQTLDQPNSNLDVSVCSSTITVNSGSSIIIGTSGFNSLRSADVKFKSKSKLDLKSGATLIINDNSTLTIDEGAILEFRSGCQIILDGPNAVLEIKGQIRIYDGATFTVSGGSNGFGHISFFKNIDPSKTRLISSPSKDGKVFLQGLGASDRLIEVDGTEGLIIDSDIVDFTIKQAHIYLGDRSVIEPNVSGMVFFEQVDIDQLFEYYEHNGIKINGVPNEFHMVRIDGGNYGFVNTGLLIGNEKLYLRAVQITNCNIGIMTYSSGITYHGGFIKGYGEAGWKSVGSNVPSDVTGVWFNNDQSNPNVIGVLIDGVNSAAETTFTGAKFQSNTSGIQAWNVPIRMKNCNYFENNFIGAQMEAWSRLDMSNNSYTTFDGNTTHFLSRFHGILHMYNGHNGFRSSGNTTIFFASLQPLAQSPSVNYGTAPPAPAAANYDASNNFFETVPVQAPTVGNNCWLDERYPHPQHRLLTLVNTALYPWNNPSIWTTAQDNECGTPDYETLDFTGSGGGLGEFIVSKYTPSLNSVTIPEGAEYGNNLLSFCSDLLDSLYQADTPNYSNIACQLNHLAKYTYSNSSAIMADLRQELLDNAMKAYALGVSRGLIFVSEDSLSYTTNCMLTTLDTLLIDANNDSFPWKNRKFHLATSKAEVLRIAEHREDALIILDSATNVYTDSLEQVYITKWSCVIEAEMAFRDSLVPLDSLYINYPCYGSDIGFTAFVINPMGIDSKKNKSEDKENSILVYPNPAQDQLSLILNNDQTIKKVVVYDLKGVIQVEGTITEESECYILDTSALNSGSYIIQIVSDNIVYNKHILIAK